MKHTRIPFYLQEAAFMDQNDPRKPGATMSYKEIADQLNAKWPDLNKQQRTRGAVIDYYNRKRQQAEMRVRMVPLPKSVSDMLSCDDIQRIVVSHCVPLGTKTQKKGTTGPV